MNNKMEALKLGINSKIEDFLKKNNFDYPEIKNFVLVNWPWSFTWIRTVVLAINTISFITKQSITPINYFDLFKKCLLRFFMFSSYGCPNYR